MRQKRQRWHWFVCVRLFIYNHVCYAHGFIVVSFSSFLLFFCLSVHSSALLSAYLSISLCVLCVCAEFGQHLQSVFCARFVFLSSGVESIPLSESKCQALWSLIIPNTVKSAKHAPRVDANQLQAHSVIYSPTHSSGRTIKRAKELPYVTV